MEHRHTPGPANAAAKAAAQAAADAQARRQRQGLALGALGVLLFGLSIPMTRLAGGTPDAPQLPPDFVAVGRAAVAGLLAAMTLALARRPAAHATHVAARRPWALLGVGAVGVVFGFPLCLGHAVRHVDAVHASVVTGFLPLATASIGAWWHRQRPSAGFWCCTLAGALVVAGYAAWRGGGAPTPADALLVAAVLFAATGYVAGARATRGGLSAQAVIGWMLVLSLPATLPWTAWLAWHHAAELGRASPAAWGGFAYVSICSMWLGFFAWYRGLALGGTLRVSQVQLLQPFVALLAAGPLLGERLDAWTLAFAAAVLATVVVGRRMPLGEPAR